MDASPRSLCDNVKGNYIGVCQSEWTECSVPPVCVEVRSLIAIPLVVGIYGYSTGLESVPDLKQGYRIVDQSLVNYPTSWIKVRIYALHNQWG